MLIAIGFPQGIIVVAFASFLRSSLMSAMRAMINNLMRALGIFLGGAIMEKYTYNTPYIFTIIFYLIGTYIFFRLFKDKIVRKAVV